MRYGIYKSLAGGDVVAAYSRRQLADWVLPHAEQTISTSAGDTFALVAGDGPDVVLLPGTNFGSTSWLGVVAALAEAFRVVALDVPGQPGLSASQRPGHPAVYGQWLGEVIRGLDLRDAVVVGHSFGASVALAGAARGAPIAGLVLYNPAGLVRLRVTLPVLAATLPWLLRPSPATAKRLLHTMTTSSIPDHLVTWMSLVGRHVRTSLAPAALPDVAVRRIRVPVAVFAGQHDPFLPPPLVRRGSDRLSGARFEAVAGAGHLLPHEQPGHLVRATQAILAQGPVDRGNCNTGSRSRIPSRTPQQRSDQRQNRASVAAPTRHERVIGGAHREVKIGVGMLRT